MEVFENGLIDQPVQYVGSNVKHSQPSKQIHPVKWQQQFMSFLSSTTASEEDLEDAKHHHSPRRKRSRKSRKSKCPCCIGSGEHHKKREKSEGSVKYHKSHSMLNTLLTHCGKRTLQTVITLFRNETNCDISRMNRL
jgi:hypothetical protein